MTIIEGMECHFMIPSTGKLALELLIALDKGNGDRYEGLSNRELIFKYVQERWKLDNPDSEGGV